jgi:hypothetical protein
VRRWDHPYSYGVWMCVLPFQEGCRFGDTQRARQVWLVRVTAEDCKTAQQVTPRCTHAYPVATAAAPRAEVAGRSQVLKDPARRGARLGALPVDTGQAVHAADALVDIAEVACRQGRRDCLSDTATRLVNRGCLTDLGLLTDFRLEGSHAASASIDPVSTCTFDVTSSAGRSCNGSSNGIPTSHVRQTGLPIGLDRALAAIA